MGRFSKPGKAPEKKYSYTEFLKGEGQPTSAAANTAASYSSKSANSAAMQVQLESSKKRPSFASPPPVRHTRCSPGAMWMHLLTLCQLLGAAGVIGVVAICLNKREQFPATTTSGNSTLPITASVCYATTRTVNACLYAYWAGAASIALSIIISAMNICCPRRRYALCLSFEAVLGLLGTAWWIAAAVTDLVFTNEANDAGLPYSTCRQATWILCWINAGLFGLSFFTSAVGCCAACGGYVDDNGEI